MPLSIIAQWLAATLRGGSSLTRLRSYSNTRKHFEQSMLFWESHWFFTGSSGSSDGSSESNRTGFRIEVGLDGYCGTGDRVLDRHWLNWRCLCACINSQGPHVAKALDSCRCELAADGESRGHNLFLARLERIKPHVEEAKPTRNEEEILIGRKYHFLGVCRAACWVYRQFMR
jgi:hypothetical protein